MLAYRKAADVADKVERPFCKITHPGRLYVAFEEWRGYTTAESVAAAFAIRHGEQPFEVVWTKPGMWQAGPVPTVIYMVGETDVSPVPEPKIETTPLAGGQLGLF